MAKFDSPVAEVLYRITLDGAVDYVGDVTTWGEIHFGIGRVTRDELTRDYAAELADADITAEQFPDNQFWILHEDSFGFVGADSYPDERSFRAACDELERQWSAFYNAQV